MSPRLPTKFDVAVVGAGPAGAATARRLAQRGCSVVLLERTHFGAPRVGESLAPGVQPLLEDLGAWSQFLATRPLPSYGTCSVWGDAVPQIHSHLVSPWGCRWHVDRRAFDHMLAEAARAAGAELYCGTMVHRCDGVEADGWVLDGLEHAADGSSSRPIRLRAHIVVDATGRRARLANCVGARRLLLDRLVGVAALLDVADADRQGYVMVEAAEDGWWYSAPLPGGQMVVMLMTDGDLCRRAGVASRPEWQARLRFAAGTRDRVGAAGVAVGPWVVSAVSQRLHQRGPCANWFAAGDAALSVDPVSGSGVVRALRSARSGADLCLAMLDDQGVDAMRGYETDRDRECMSYMRERTLYYGIEQRWRDAPFWLRRAKALSS